MHNTETHTEIKCKPIGVFFWFATCFIYKVLNLIALLCTQIL